MKTLIMDRILIADDNEENIYLLRILLESNGYEVESAVNGMDALARARINPPALIISDILMPVMDGFALCLEWKKDKQLKDIPLIFYTATFTDDKDRALAQKLGADQFMIKPTDPATMILVVRDVISRIPRKGQPYRRQETIYTQYNESLIRRLEAKMLEVDRMKRELEETYAGMSQVMDDLKAGKTSLQQTEEALRMSEKKYRELIEKQS